MIEKGRRDFRIECRKETGYFLQKSEGETMWAKLPMVSRIPSFRNHVLTV